MRTWDVIVVGAGPAGSTAALRLGKAGVQTLLIEKAAAFRKAFKELETRIKLFTSLPIDSLDSMTLKAKIHEIGNSEGATKPS